MMMTQCLGGLGALGQVQVGCSGAEKGCLFGRTHSLFVESSVGNHQCSDDQLLLHNKI